MLRDRTVALIILVCLIAATTASAALDQRITVASMSYYPDIVSTEQMVSRGMVFDTGDIEVVITDENGRVIYESTYSRRIEGARVIEWAYRPEPQISRQITLSVGQDATMEGMLFAGNYIVRMMRDGRRTPQNSHGEWVTNHELEKVNDDNWGCDGVFSNLSCTSVGNCCDKHDACFAIWNCNALSWLGLGSAQCMACDFVVAGCITTGIGSSGEPSDCCAIGNCGSPRTEADAGGFVQNIDDVLNRDQYNDGSSGGGGGWIDTPHGSVYYSNGTCRFPDGTILPCG